ncbi:MAG: C25 family cysteine peptidase [Promethearchaeota archaeon]
MVQFSSKKFKFSCLFLLIFLPIVNLGIIIIAPNPNNTDSMNLGIVINKPLEVDLSFLPDIDYNILNDQWYNPKIEMLIITPNQSDFIEAVKPLAEWKNEKGLKTIILSNFSLYDGTDDAESIRNMIKSYYEKENIQWILLAGDAENDLIPIRKVYNPDVLRWGNGRTETVGGEYLKPTDYYYADLTSTWDNDGTGNKGDGFWGEAPKDTDHGLDEISWIPEVYVGRLPASNALELEIMVNKTLKYETNPYISNWINRMLLAGGVSSYSVSIEGSGEYESALTSYIIQNYVKSVLNYSHLVKESGNLTRTLLRSNFNDGYSTVIMAGHGSPTSYYIDPGTVGYTSDDADDSSNTHMPSLVYLDSCSTSSYDINDGSVGEILIKRKDAGAIGVVGGLRVNWYFEDDENLEKLNRGNAKLFWEEFYVNKKFQQGRALYDSKVTYLNSDYYIKGSGSTTYDFERKNLLTYNLLGDPEVDIYTDTPLEARNPFKINNYEGERVSIVIKDLDNELVPYARVHFRTLDKKYFTVYADANGVAEFRLPKQKNEIYNVTITGHNLIPSHFSFSTIKDDIKPELLEISYVPKNPSTSNDMVFNVETLDNRSGIESVYLFISDDNLQTYSYYATSNDLLENENIFTFTIDKPLPDEYSYFVFIRDYANNTNLFYDENFRFTIPKPLIDYMLPVFLIVIIGIVGISTVLLVKGMQKYTRIVENIA